MTKCCESKSYLNFKLPNKFLHEYKDYTETSKYVIKYYLKNIHITINLIILNLIVRVKSTKVLINKKSAKIVQENHSGVPTRVCFNEFPSTFEQKSLN